MRIAIIGAGAIGGWLGARLAGAGNDVGVIARGATLAAIKTNGLILDESGRESRAHVTASDDPADLGPQDLVIIAVKGPAMRAVAPAVAALLGPDTIVLPAMNGVPWWFFAGARGPLAGTALASVDPDGAIARLIPTSALSAALSTPPAQRPDPGALCTAWGRA